ncbi:MAG: PAS domain-containing sensor histidine kinase [Methanoregula sp.]|nr:PAS domain-containing sensor histidine kinase [Methanoregula sp.]
MSERYEEILRLSVIAIAGTGAILTTIFSLINGIIEVFPFLYVVPIILFVYYYPERGILFAASIGAVYPVLVTYYGNFAPQLIVVAVAWYIVFVTIGIVTASLARGLRADERKYQEIFENSQAGIFTFDIKTLLIKEVNNKFAQMLKYGREELPGREILHITQNPQNTDQFLSRIKMRHENGDIELTCMTKDYATRQLLVSASVTPDDIVICSAIDITERKLAETVIATSRDELEKKVNERTVELYKTNEDLKGEIQERRRFESAIQLANRKLNTLSNITRHDILNQITAITMYLSLAREFVNNPTTQDYLVKIEKVTKLIQRQIQFTRDYQNIGASAPQWQNVTETLDNVLMDFDMKGVRIERELGDIEIFADLLLGKVFSSLIDNSLRHGEKLTLIRFSYRETDDGAILFFEDDGVGIPENAKERIFKREYYRNTGYGLFLAGEVLGITGLSIRETGEPGKGARFEIHAPRGSYRFANKENVS